LAVADASNDRLTGQDQNKFSALGRHARLRARHELPSFETQSVPLGNTAETLA
jgi:hypothetical protein